MNPKPLTAKQTAVYEYIRECILQRGYGPTLREIAQEMNISSPNGVVCHLEALEAKSKIVRTSGRSRSIELAEPIARVFQPKVELRGRVLSGACLLSDTVSEHLNLGIQSDTTFALLVQDTSLQAAAICKGDFLLVDPVLNAKHGDLVLLRQANNEHVAGYWLRDNQSARLQPVDSGLPPLGLAADTLAAAADVEIWVVVGVVRRFL